MELTWYGRTCVRLKGRDAVVVADAYQSVVGPTGRGITGDIVTFSHPDDTPLPKAKGRTSSDAGTHLPTSLDEAIQNFDHAVRISADWALAWAALGEASWLKFWNRQLDTGSRESPARSLPVKLARSRKSFSLKKEEPTRRCFSMRSPSAVKNRSRG